MDLNNTYRQFLGFELKACFNDEQTAIGLANFDKLTDGGKHPERAFKTIHNGYFANASETNKALQTVKGYIDEKNAEPRTVNGYVIEAFRQMNKGAINNHQQRQLDYIRKAVEKHNGKLDKLVGIKVNGVEITQDDLDAQKLKVPSVAMRRERFEANASLPASEANTPLAKKTQGCEVTVTLFNNR